MAIKLAVIDVLTKPQKRGKDNRFIVATHVNTGKKYPYGSARQGYSKPTLLDRLKKVAGK